MKEFFDHPSILPILVILAILWIRLLDNPKPNHLNFDAISIQKMTADAEKFFKN